MAQGMHRTNRNGDTQEHVLLKHECLFIAAFLRHRIRRYGKFKLVDVAERCTTSNTSQHANRFTLGGSGHTYESRPTHQITQTQTKTFTYSCQYLLKSLGVAVLVCGMTSSGTWLACNTNITLDVTLWLSRTALLCAGVIYQRFKMLCNIGSSRSVRS